LASLAIGNEEAKTQSGTTGTHVASKSNASGRAALPLKGVIHQRRATPWKSWTFEMHPERAPRTLLTKTPDSC
jgi:hypothetical protein